MESIDVEIEGLEDCLDLFAAPPDAATSLH